MHLFFNFSDGLREHLKIVVGDVALLDALRAKQLLGPLLERVDWQLMLLTFSVRWQEWFSDIGQVFADISVGPIRITTIFPSVLAAFVFILSPLQHRDTLVPSMSLQLLFVRHFLGLFAAALFIGKLFFAFNDSPHFILALALFRFILREFPTGRI